MTNADGRRSTRSSINFDELLPKKSDSRLRDVFLIIWSIISLLSLPLLTVGLDGQLRNIFLGLPLEDYSWLGDFFLVISLSFCLIVLTEKFIDELLQSTPRSDAYYEIEEYDKIMKNLFEVRFLERGWSKENPPDLIEHIDEIMSTSRVASDRTTASFSKLNRRYRWIIGAGSCLTLLPTNIVSSRLEKMLKSDDALFVDDWVSAFGPLESALKTRQADLRNWEQL